MFIPGETVEQSIARYKSEVARLTLLIDAIEAAPNVTREAEAEHARLSSEHFSLITFLRSVGEA